MRIAAALVLSLAAPPALAAPVAVHGGWGVVERGGRCDALALADRKAAKGKVQAVAGFAFEAGPGRSWSRFHAQLARMPRPDASVVARVGGQSFLLVTRNGLAWSRDARQDQALIAAVRSAAYLRIVSRDRSGRRFSDNYALAGAPTAIDAAAALCARTAGKSR